MPKLKIELVVAIDGLMARHAELVSASVIAMLILAVYYSPRRATRSYLRSLSFRSPLGL